MRPQSRSLNIVKFPRIFSNFLFCRSTISIRVNFINFRKGGGRREEGGGRREEGGGGRREEGGGRREEGGGRREEGGGRREEGGGRREEGGGRREEGGGRREEGGGRREEGGGRREDINVHRRIHIAFIAPSFCAEKGRSVWSQTTTTALVASK